MPHCNREEFDAISKPDRRFLDTLAAYLLPRLVLTRTLRLLENRLCRPCVQYSETVILDPLMLGSKSLNFLDVFPPIEAKSWDAQLRRSMFRGALFL